MKKVIFVIALLVLAIACEKETPQIQPGPHIPDIEVKIPGPYPDIPEYEPPPSAPTAVEIKIEAQRYDFLPSEIKVKKGDLVRLTVTSQDVSHTFVIPEYGINEQLPLGQDVIIEFIADKEGMFTYLCDIPGHEAMKGKLIVT